MPNDYSRQNRGSSGSYASYYAGMDKTMRQKVALICSHFPAQGKLADMGSGSGKGSFDLASLYPGLSVTGVDISSEAVKHAQQAYQLPNLSFLVGDIAAALFPDASMDGFLNSSVLHHVTSFNGFSLEKVSELLDQQSRALRVGGILAIRDFVVPDGPRDILLDLPTSDGAEEGNVGSLSSAALFRKFCATFKCSAYPNSNLPYREELAPEKNWARFGVSLRLATEFILRKDYRDAWDVELREEYLYFSQSQFEEQLRRRGLRILISRPISNPWIVSNRWKNKVRLFDLELNSLPFPPTNYLIIGQKCEKDEGVDLVAKTATPVTAPRFLRIESFEEKSTGHVWDLVSRPFPTLDVIPWFRHEGELFVVARSGYPRPIVRMRDSADAIQKLVISGYLIEPISASYPGKMDDASISEMVRESLLRQGIKTLSKSSLTKGFQFFPSAGGVGETVRQVFVEVEADPEIRIPVVTPHGLSSQATLRAFHAQHTLRAYQAGGMVDNRMEVGIYALLAQQNEVPEAWIGDPIAFPARPKAPASSLLVVKDLLERIERSGQSFKPSTPSKSSGTFLKTIRGTFVERNAEGKELGGVELEYVVPGSRTLESLTVLPYQWRDDGPWVGLELRHLPAPQLENGSSALLCVPAWRLTKEETKKAPAEMIAHLLQRDFKVSASQVLTLGSPYFPSAGTTPEVCSVYATEVAPSRESLLEWVPFEALFRSIDQLRSGHLLTALLRFKHASDS